MNKKTKLISPEVLMCWTEEEKKAFKQYVDSELIHEPIKLIGGYKFYLGTLKHEITIRLFVPFQSQQILFEQSHFIHTPTQLGAYETSRPWNDNVYAAINQVLQGFTEYYNSAIRAGYEPDDSWLVPNPNFRN